MHVSSFYHHDVYTFLYRYQQFISTIHGSSRLFEELIYKLLKNSKDTYHIKAIKANVSLLLTAACRLKVSTESNGDLKITMNEEISKAVNSVYPSLEKWVKTKLSGEAFGGCRTYFYEHNSKAELKVYYFLTCINVYSDNSK